MNEAIGRLIVKSGFGIILAFVAWTVVASLVFLVGTGLLHDFPHPFYQWWMYALNFDGNPRVARWLKIGAGAGVVPPVMMISAIIYRGRQVVGPRLRRPLFGGTVKSPLAVTDNHGRAEWMSMEKARERFPGVNPAFGGIVIGEAYRVDQDNVADKRFDPECRATINMRTRVNLDENPVWGEAGRA
jgi:type IV secretion system protein VirD4